MSNTLQQTYKATLPTLEDGQDSGFISDVNGRLKVSATLETGDIELGSVELKDGSSDTRASIITDNEAAGTPNVLMVGAKYNSTLPTYTTGDAGSLQIGARGSINATLFPADGGSPIPTTAVTSDANAAPTALAVVSNGRVFNGTTWDRQRGDTTGTYAVGNIASAATDSGNPIKIGGKYNSTLPTFTDGQRGDVQIGSRGSLNVTLFSVDSATPINSGAPSTDAVGVQAGITTRSQNTSFNGSTWDRIRSGIITPTATLTGHQNTLPWALYNATPTTRTEGQGGPLQATTLGGLNVNQETLIFGEDSTNSLMATMVKPIAKPLYAPSLYSEITQVTKANIKASLGNVLSIYITNDNAAVRYFQLHNKATAPAATDVPIYSFKVPAGTANNPGTLVLDNTFFTQAGAHFATGIGWAISTTYGTFTDSATASEHIAFVHYI